MFTSLRRPRSSRTPTRCVRSAMSTTSARPSRKFTTGAVLVVDGGNAQWGDVWPGGKPAYFDLTSR